MPAVGFYVTAKATHMISYRNRSCLKLKHELSFLNYWTVMFLDSVIRRQESGWNTAGWCGEDRRCWKLQHWRKWPSWMFTIWRSIVLFFIYLLDFL